MSEVNPDIFHKHLDVCERCRTRPFDLCPVGRVKILVATGELVDAPDTAKKPPFKERS